MYTAWSFIREKNVMTGGAGVLISAASNHQRDKVADRKIICSVRMLPDDNKKLTLLHPFKN